MLDRLEVKGGAVCVGVGRKGQYKWKQEGKGQEIQKITRFSCDLLRQPVLVRFLVPVFLRFASSFPPSFC